MSEDTITEVETATYTVEQAAKKLGISRSLAYQLAQENKLPVLRLGWRLVVPKVKLDAMVAGEPW